MPKRQDIDHVLVIGSGPIQIGQAAEFDYSGTQACRVLRSEGMRVTLVNSNPATIMTDPEVADATYVEPIESGIIEQIIATERPDALLPTLGGQTALNAAIELHDQGILEKYDVELIGADFDAIQRGEDRQKFKEVVRKVGGDVPRSATCHSMEEVRATVADLGLPAVIRPSFTMGGLGSGMAYTDEDVERIAGNGLAESPTTEVLIEESVLGWKEYELELMRDRKDNVVVVCSIENIDPMGVHTGDSVTVAPSMTLTDREYQHMRDIGIAVLREVGVDTGGCNIQFAIDPENGRIIVIEMNPRVSRSSALASKATGFPIAKIAAKLAIGYTLDEIPNDVTRATPAAFEPALDYVVVKVPRFAFEKFPGADPTLTTTMKSVGEAMSLGRTFKQALQKALRSSETKSGGFWTSPDPEGATVESTMEDLRTAREGSLYSVERALRLGATVEQVHEASKIDPWFLDQVAELVALSEEVSGADILDAALLRRAKRAGCSDAQIAALRPELAGEAGVRELRHRLDVRPVFKTVDTCSAEFASKTPYHYSSYDEETEVEPSAKQKIMILGSGPNRIGQGIEFDYSCVHAVQALREAGYETIMVNCNPETVSTDYDTADRLYFEPLTFEDVTEVYHAEDSSGKAAGGEGVVGVIVQLGGQTPLALAKRLEADGLPVIGTSPEAIDNAEDRGVFERLLHAEGLVYPAGGVATSFAEAKEVAGGIGYPVLVRPSYVLGGRGMEIVYDEASLEDYIARATEASPEHPVLVDRFLDDAVEIDVDCLCDGEDFYLGGVMEHIEEAGVHSGDSSCALPPVTLGSDVMEQIRRYTSRLAFAIGVRGLMNVQYALKDEQLYVLEANPRASRTVPFVSKATGHPLAKAAARIMAGSTIAELRGEGLLAAEGDGSDLGADAPISVKEVVLPFKRFRTSEGGGIDALLGPEMKSTGEVMGIDSTFGLAFAKSTLAVHGRLPAPVGPAAPREGAGKAAAPARGRVFVSVADRDKRSIVFPVQQLVSLGFEVYATVGTGLVLKRHGIAFTPVGRHSQGLEGAPDAVELIKSGEVDLVITTPSASSGPRTDGWEIRTAAVVADVPCITTIQGAGAAVMGIEAAARGELSVSPLQKLHSVDEK
ncbi:carbamoyl-phosphate synthase large subunit [Salininema proteolyticum]|uniref:Carbamoyl phosphate synthase large chain n=1 Tax=Salininema proteolyticum TaxID=1607685 RepID=A0ABV8U0P0_9ACTN